MSYPDTVTRSKPRDRLPDRTGNARKQVTDHHTVLDLDVDTVPDRTDLDRPMWGVGSGGGRNLPDPFGSGPVCGGTDRTDEDGVPHTAGGPHNTQIGRESNDSERRRTTAVKRVG